jgi:hypothetical protein
MGYILADGPGPQVNRTASASVNFELPFLLRTDVVHFNHFQN